MKAYQNPQIWATTSPSQTWANDDTILKHLQTFFGNWSLAYDNVGYMADLLSDKAATIAEYYNKLYQTTLYKYNALNAVDEYTEREFEEDEGENAQNDIKYADDATGTGKNYDLPYNSSTPKQTDETSSDSTSSGTRSDLGTVGRKKKYKEKVHRHGNVGISSAAYYIQEERNILINILDKYTEEFKPFFRLDVDVVEPTTEEINI